jgi:hypothetical protein
MLILTWLVFAVIVAVAANSRGRNPLGWLVLACIISPLLAAIVLVVLPSRGEAHSWMDKHEGRVRSCPHCAEFIKPQAVVCKHCGRDVPSNPSARTRAPRVGLIEWVTGRDKNMPR